MDALVLGILLKLVMLLTINCVFVAVAVAGCMLLARRKKATFAVLYRNFVGYFSNPTGYVFICVFVFLSSVAAFWSQDFFNSNLATLDQLNRWFPFIMLVFIPAITMSIWAEERRQGTDELLLTIPATDLDIVLGKYLAAAAIFSSALLFSEITNFAVLNSLAEGDVDLGLFVTTYIGYWFVGLAMLAIGMAASFLTDNLTVGFILGALFNAPLACLMLADRFVAGQGLAQKLSWWSYSDRFGEFGRGVISLSSVMYFVLVALVGIYLSWVLIGRRHWYGGKDGNVRWFHYATRFLALCVIAMAGSKLISHFNVLRLDTTSAKISSLAPDSKKILRNLGTDKTVLIEAFISEAVPEQFVKTKVDLVNKLREMETVAGGELKVVIYDDLEPFTEEASIAQEKYGIEAQTVMTRSRGAIKQEDLYMGAAISCGLERVIVPFFDRGIPVEYELVRSIATAAKGSRRKLGVVKTDAELFGGFDMARMSQRPKQLIIEELEKAFDVEEVDMTMPLQEGAYDVLLVVQPSSLPEPQLQNLLAAIKDGQPTALFEDPFPAAMGGVPGTNEPRRPQGGGMAAMMGGGGQVEPKGDITQLWSLLGIEMVGERGPSGEFAAQVVWQDYNPYVNKVKVDQITPEWVFASPDAPGADDTALNVADPVSAGLHEVLFLFPGGIKNNGARDLKFTPLISTGDATGAIGTDAIQENMRNQPMMRILRSRSATGHRYIIGAEIEGYLRDDLTQIEDGVLYLAQADVPQPPTLPPTNKGEGKKPAPLSAVGDDGASTESAADANGLEKNGSEKKEGDADRDDRQKEVHVVVVTDIDLVSSDFLQIRAQPDEEVNWQFENVTFVLNILDRLAGDEELIEIRKRQTRHSTLKMVERKTEQARSDAQTQISEFEDQYNKAVADAEARLEKNNVALKEKIEELQSQGSSRELQQEVTKLAIQQQVTSERLKNETEVLLRDRNRKLQKIEHDLDLQVRHVQSNYKLWAALLPPIPPLLLGLVVWNRRRTREREGVAATRLR